MATISQNDRITFECPDDWKREVEKRLIDMGKNKKQACIEALSAYTGVAAPSEPAQDAA
jgi:hypothetical protein